MAELALAGVTLAYEQSRAGDDIVWLAPGDSPGANWRRYQTPRIAAPVHAIAFSQDLQTPPQRVREVAQLAGNGHFHLLEGLGHGSAFGHRPEVVNACVRSILDGESQRVHPQPLDGESQRVHPQPLDGESQRVHPQPLAGGCG